MLKIMDSKIGFANFEFNNSNIKKTLQKQRHTLENKH